MADWQGGEEGAKASLFERVHTLGQHAQSVSSVKFSPSGDIVASTGADGSVKLFSTSSLELLRAFSLPSAASDIAWSRGSAGEDGSHILVACDDCNLYLHRTSTGKRLLDFTAHMKEVFCCAFSPSGGICASGSEDETLRFWDPQTGHNTRTIPAHADPVTSVDFSGNGECICTSSFDGTVRLWNARDGNVIVTFTAKLPIAPPAGCARFTPNSKYIAVSYLSSFGMLVDIGNLAGINNSKSNNEQQGSTDMDAATQQLKAMRKFVSHTNDEFAAFLAFPHLPRVSGGRGLLFGSEDGHSCLYEIQSAKVAQRLDGDSDPSTSTAETSEFAGNGKGLEAEGGAGTNTTSANASAGTAIEGSKRGHTEAVLAVDAHPKVPLCVTGAMHPDCSVKLWSPRTQFTQQQSPQAQEKQS